jgi:hypothetical protein
MTLLDTPRSRKTVFWLAFASAVILGLLFAHQVTGAYAAKRAVLAEESRIASQPAATATQHAQAAPVLVELFTSEGCSSCPPADTLLARLQLQQPVPSADIIVLEEHVDYWENLGWHDRFASHQFTDRQTAYAQRLHLDDNYTPQMVVDGTDQFVGNDSSHALRAVTQAARTPKFALMLSPLTREIGDRINVSVSTLSATSLPQADLYAALIETTASTQVLHGENGDRTLHHVSVVRAMQKIATSNQLAHPLFFSFAIPKDATFSNLRVVAFAQRSGQGAVVGAVTSAAPLPAN